MSPGYLRLDGLNASHSRLAGKYSLWLYREQGWDLSNKVRIHTIFYMRLCILHFRGAATWRASVVCPRQCWIL
jgi:hypothetical protein